MSLFVGEVIGLMVAVAAEICCELATLNMCRVRQNIRSLKITYIKNLEQAFLNVIGTTARKAKEIKITVILLLLLLLLLLLIIIIIIQSINRHCNFGRQKRAKKEAEKILKHKNITTETQRMWNVSKRVLEPSQNHSVKSGATFLESTTSRN